MMSGFRGMKWGGLVCALLALMLVPGVAMATGNGIDTTEVLAALDDMEGAIVTVGGAIVAIAAIAVAFKWIKGALFG